MTEPTQGRHQGPTEEPLSRLLHDAVSDVEPAPALDRIRNRTKVTPMSSKRPWIVATAAALATAATVTAFAVIQNRDGSPDRTNGVAATTTQDPTPSQDAS